MAVLVIPMAVVVAVSAYPDHVGVIEISKCSSPRVRFFIHVPAVDRDLAQIDIMVCQATISRIPQADDRVPLIIDRTHSREQELVPTCAPWSQQLITGKFQSTETTGLLIDVLEPEIVVLLTRAFTTEYSACKRLVYAVHQRFITIVPDDDRFGVADPISIGV